jgi:hypothetical protein
MQSQCPRGWTMLVPVFNIDYFLTSLRHEPTLILIKHATHSFNALIQIDQEPVSLFRIKLLLFNTKA